MFKLRNLIAVAYVGLIALVLVGCGAGITSVSPDKPTVAEFSLYKSATRDGVMHTVVVGDIANSDAAQVRAVVNQAFGAVHIGTPTVFDSTPDSVDASHSRIVVLFSARRDFGPSQFCDNDAALPAALVEPEGGRIRVVGAFCVDDEVKTWSILNGPAPASAGDPVLLQIAKRMAFDIIPERSAKTPGDCMMYDC